MSYKWRPSASQKREFAQRMQNDTTFASAYNERKALKKERFYKSLDEAGSGCQYVPTREQHDFVVFNRPCDLTSEQEDACNQVAYGFSCNEKIDRHYIHIVNELRRKSYN